MSNRKITVAVFETATLQTFRVPFHSTSLTLDTLIKQNSSHFCSKLLFRQERFTFM